ncbi:MAG TPA: hypothetical protein VG738_21270 [Chitinophagaceae bacterium]|nr:hypothetical protein [Chitinophagaceae bacterium]
MFLTNIIQKPVVLAFIFSIAQVAVKAQENAVQPKNYYSSDFEIDGISRVISFYIPRGYGKNDTYPVVFVLHGENETGKTVVKRYGDYFERLADSAASIVVYPDGVNGHWNTKMGKKAAADTINDAGFINIMIDYFVQQYKGDPGRIFAMGFGDGGQMVWRLACNSPKRVIAIAPFIASIADAQKSCALDSIPFFNAEKYVRQPTGKFGYQPISDAFNFLLEHAAR